MEKEELLKFIGRKIKEYRKKKGLTQEELANKIGDIKNNSISAYERGAVNIDSNTLFALSGVLEVKVDDLFPPIETEVPYMEKVKDMRNENLDVENMRFFQELVGKTVSMSGEERQKFLESIRFTVDYHDKMNK